MHTLLPKKLTSVSSAEMYERVLLLGVRCVELDIHDGQSTLFPPQDGVPELKHGGTLTTRLKLADALGAIRKHAFAASDFPLILSLEVHCSLKQQAVLAKAL
ncbi:putative phosphatidylinositol-4,5-bisphosphate phosphodiesterase gamma 2, partial [Pavlovales sp. CCMP2436]